MGRCRVAITRFDMEILGVLRNRALWKWFPNDQHQTLGISAYFDIFRIYILHSCDKTLPALFLLVTSHNLSIFESYPSDWLVTSLVSMVFIPAIQGRNGECSFFFIHIVDYLGKKRIETCVFPFAVTPMCLDPAGGYSCGCRGLREAPGRVKSGHKWLVACKFLGLCDIWFNHCTLTDKYIYI